MINYNSFQKKVFLNYIKQNTNSIVLISDSKNLIDTLTVDDVTYILIDNLNYLNINILNKIFSFDKTVVFVNDIIEDSKEFNSKITTQVLSFFNSTDDYKFHNVILYGNTDFINKKTLFKLSDFADKNVINKSFTLNNVDSIYYVGQSGMSGYANAAKGYIADYILKGHSIQWHPLYFDTSKNDNTYYVDVLSESAIKTELKETDITILHSTPDLWKEYSKSHQKSERIVGYTVWETESLPKKWVKNINELDEVWVPSTYNKEVFENSGVTSHLKIVPHAYHKENLFKKSDVTIYDYLGTKIPSDKYTFYSIAEFHTRKGIEECIQVFDAVYAENNNVQLILKLHYLNNDIKSISHIFNSINKITDNIGKSIYIITERLSRKEILMLHSFGDCYVSLNKGEAFGLTIFDANNFGKPVITTKYGGPLDFIDNDIMVECKIDQVSGMDKFSKNYDSSQKWAYPDLDDAYDKMKLLV
jgi:glycosyltransferase involved in cell wall biosynthesis